MTKNTLKIFGPKTWCTKKPFGYRVAHHRYLLTSRPELYSCHQNCTSSFDKLGFFLQ